MKNQILFLMPGPVPMADSVRMALTGPAIDHRSSEFMECYNDICSMLKPIFGTKNQILIPSLSGTGGEEAAICTFGTNKRIISLINGKFGDRFAEVAALYGDCVRIESEWGHPFDLEKLEDELKRGADIVTLTHNETSVGLLNPVMEISKIVKKYDALLIVDCVTSIAGDEVKVDEWGIDIAITGSQKSLASAPGLCAISVSEKAWSRLSERHSFYLDLTHAKKFADGDMSEVPATPAIPLYFALREACKLVVMEGLEERIMRHRKMSAAIRAACDAWGLKPSAIFNDLYKPSNTVTGYFYPKGIDDAKFRSLCKEMGVDLAGGQGYLAGKMFRIGNMGNIDFPEILTAVSVMQHCLIKCGYDINSDGIDAARNILGL